MSRRPQKWTISARFIGLLGGGYLVGFTPVPKSVLLVDDNAVFRHVLWQFFASEADFHVCGEAENGRQAIEKAQELHPNLIVMDLSMPVMNGIHAALVLKRLMPRMLLIIFSGRIDVVFENEARSAGVSALVSKSEQVSVLIDKARRLFSQVAA